MRIALESDLLSALDDRLDRLRVERDVDARNEERRADPFVGEQLEDQRQTDARPVAALRQNARSLGVAGVHREPHGLRVDVEGEGRG